MKNILDQNKEIVKRFNKEYIEEGKSTVLDALVSNEVINHSAPAGMPSGKESISNFLNGVLRTGFPDLRVEILEQIAERDLVTTRKKIIGTHTGEIFGILPSNKKVEINVIDIIRLKDGKYIEHWGQSNFSDVIAEISKK